MAVVEVDVLRAIKTFFAGNRRVVEGELVKIDDPIMKGREHLFEVLHTGRHKPKPGTKPVAAPAPVRSPGVAPQVAPQVAPAAPEGGGS